MKLRIFLFLAICSAVMLSGCAGNSKTLNVYNWGDYIDEEVLDMFEEETGIKVNYETFATNEDMYAKIKAGGTNYDVVIPSEYMIEKMRNENMLIKINIDNIPNYKYINEDLKALDISGVSDYNVPYMWGTVGIVYNMKNIPNPEHSWDIIWDETYKSRILMMDSQRDAIGISLKRLGYSLNSTDLEELREAGEELKRQKPLVKGYSGDYIKEQMIGEEGDLAVMWSGDAYYVSQENENLGYFVPREGSNIWFDGAVILATSKNVPEAEQFIDFLCRPDIALRNTEYIGYTTPNTEAFKMLDDEMKNNPIYDQRIEGLSGMEVFKDLGDFIEEYGIIWTEVLAE